MKAASISITAGWSAGESRATRSSAWMPPMRTSTFSQPSCPSAFAYRPVTCPSRDSANLRAVNNSAPVASSPAPSAGTRPRVASCAVRGSSPLAGPPSRCASQSPAGTSTTRAAAGASPTAATPPSVHRMPRCEAAHRFITCKTLGEQGRLRGPFRRQRRRRFRRSSWPGTLGLHRCSPITRRAAPANTSWDRGVKTGWMPCLCTPAREAAGRSRRLGHLWLHCQACHQEHRDTTPYEPPHQIRHRPMFR